MSPDLMHRLFIPERRPAPRPIQAGLYRFDYWEGDEATRFHLRVDPDGQGVLVADASALACLSPSGVIIARAVLEGADDDQILRDLDQLFTGGSTHQLRADIATIRRLLRDLETPGDVYPVLNLDDPASLPDRPHLMPPIEATLPLAEPSLLKPILTRLWEAGIPHATLLVFPEPYGNHLIAAVRHAQQVGLVCGVSGRASDLILGSLLGDLVEAGVDHITVSYASADSAIHDDLLGRGDHAAAQAVFRETEALEVADVGHVPLIQQTVGGLEATLESLLAWSVPTLRFFAIAAEADDGSGAIPALAMRQIAAQVEEDATSAKVRYLWEPPLQRDPTIPLATQVLRGPRCTGDMAIRVEPDGSVIAPRGPYRIAGNLLVQDWQTIWNSDAFRSYRTRIESPTRCAVCPGLAICAADCPTEPAGWASGLGTTTAER